MADPNTQIDWWIAQAWQEAQGGADSDALVAWLHENGLTAVSSYTILQAALSCSSEEAKQMVFGHPVWAGADADTDLSEAEYTSDTLEPEPEPDATFGLDDWADEIEEDEPVYGEPGYEPPPSATPTRPAAADGDAPPQRSMLLDAYAEMEEEEAAGGLADLGASGYPHADAGEMFAAEEPEIEQPETFAPEETYSASEMEPVAELEPEAQALFEAEDSDEDEPEIDADQVFEMEPGWGADAAEAEAAPVAGMAPPSSPAPQEEIEEQLEPAPMPAPKPAPAAPPPILRMPPATPAERAATFAAAFGKKPSTLPRQSAETGRSSTGSLTGGPPSIDPGPAAQAETAPAQNPAEPPQPVPAAAPMPPPLELEPMPEFAAPPPIAQVEPLFTAGSARETSAAPPLFPPKPEQPAADAPEAFTGDNVPTSGLDSESEVEVADMEPQQEDGMSAGGGDILAGSGIAEATWDIPADRMDDGPASIEAQDTEYDAVDFIQEPPALETDDNEDLPEPEIEELPAMDWEEEPPEFETLEPEDSSDADDNPSIEKGREPSRKRVLLDPSEEYSSKSAAEGDTENLTEVAKRLGINFHGAGPEEDAGIDPEMSKVAKELGISFRDGGGGPDTPDDEVALEAQKLGISFRDENVTGKPPKPLIVKYLPMFLGLIAIFFLLLLGATFSGTFIGWLKG